MSLRRLCHLGPIVALSIIAVLFMTSIMTIISWVPPNNLKSIVNAVLFHFWVLNILKNFFKSAFIGPGHIPFQWKPSSKGTEELLQFCECCQGYKAPRAHHCKTCKRCVMKMDHHCPWINNCVGHCNHRSFTLFLIFVIVGCSHAAVMMALCIWDHIAWRRGDIMLKVYEDSMLPMHHYLLISLLFGTGLSVGVTIAVSFLFYYQFKSIIKNETGIESWIVEKAQSRRRLPGDIFVYPYDLGIKENIKQVLVWSADYVGDGITWKVREGCDQYNLTIEQLEQKDLKRYRTVPYKVVYPFSGRCFPIVHGCQVLYDAPWNDECRLRIKPGDLFHATRHRQHWVYGEKICSNASNGTSPLALGETRREKGWVPKCCLEEEPDEDSSVCHSSKKNNKKNK